MSKEEEPPPLTPDEENADILFVFFMDPTAVRNAEGVFENRIILDEDKMVDITNDSDVFIQELRRWMEQNEINGGILNIHQFRAMLNASSMQHKTVIRGIIGTINPTSKVFYKEEIKKLPRRVRAPAITTSAASFARENINGIRSINILGSFVLPIQVIFTGLNRSSLEVNIPAGEFVNPGIVRPKIQVGTQTGPVRVISNGIELRPFTLTIDEPAVQPEADVQPVRPADARANIRPAADVQPAVRPVIRTGDVVNGRIVPPPGQRPGQSGLSGPGPSGPDVQPAVRPAVQPAVIRTEDRVNGQRVPTPRRASGPELADLSSDDEDEGLQQALLLSQIPEPITTLDQLVSAMFNKIDLDGSGAINIAEIYEFINILPPLEEVHFFTTELSANDEVRRQVVEYIDDNGDLSLAKFKEFIEGIAKNLHSEEDRNYFYQFLINYVRPPPPPPPVVVQLPSEIVFQAIAGGQENITVGQIRDFLIQAGVPVRIVAQIITTNYGRDSEENILSQTDFTNSFFDFTQPVQDTLLNYARTRVTAPPAASVTPAAARVTPAAARVTPAAARVETKEEKADREMAAIERNLEEQARINRQTAETGFNSEIPGLRRKRGKTYKQLYDDSWTEMDPRSNSRMTGVHFAKQRNLQETLEVLRDYYNENSRRLGTGRYDAQAIKRDLLSWLASDSEFSTETRTENGMVIGPITQRSRERMVNRVMDCVHDQRVQNGTTDENIHVDSTDLLKVIYTFVKGQSNPKFRSGFAAAWVKGVIEAYFERNDLTREIVDGVTVFTYEDEPDPHVSCAPGTTHRILPAFNETLSRVFGENPPEMTEAEKQAALRPERSRKINRWLQLSINEPNATRQSSINFINGKISEEGSNPAQWRAIVGDNELTIPEFVDQLYRTLEGGKRRNKRRTKRVKTMQTKSKAKTNPLKKRTRKI